jgi:hypothetical protein
MVVSLFGPSQTLSSLKETFPAVRLKKCELSTNGDGKWAKLVWKSFLETRLAQAQIIAHPQGFVHAQPARGIGVLRNLVVPNVFGGDSAANGYGYGCGVGVASPQWRD